MHTIQADASGSIEKAAEVLKTGGVIAMPTETVYGLACLWGNEVGRERIYELKKRPAEKRLQMLASSVEIAVKAGLEPSDLLNRIARRFWPGPLTVVARSCVGGSIGLRIPSHPFVLGLLERLGEPLACTSANLSGEPAGICAKGAVVHLAGEVDLLVDGGEVLTTGGQASTVLSLLGEQPAILRQGPIALEDLLKA